MVSFICILHFCEIFHACFFTFVRVYIGRVSETAYTHPANSDREHSRGCGYFQTVAFRSICRKGKVSIKNI